MALPSGTGSGGYNAGDETDRAARLFPNNKGDIFAPEGVFYSPVFSVVDAPVIVRAYNLPENSIACLQMVTGCNGGDTFAPFVGEGRCWCLTQCETYFYLEHEGRYRICLENADPNETIITFTRSSIISLHKRN